MDVDCAVIGDAKASLAKLATHLERRERSEWFRKIAAWKERYPFTFLDDSVNAKPQYVIQELHKQTKGEAIITTGVGQHQMWAAQHYRWTFPRPDDHQRRPGHDGLRACRRRWARSSARRTRSWSTSTATPRSR